MSMTRNQRTALDTLLNKGDLEGAAQLMRSIAGPTPDPNAPPAEPPPPPEPRRPEEIVLDLFKGIHSLLGNTPALVALINELEELVNPPSAAAADKPKA